MNFDKKVFGYLNASKFSNGLQVRIRGDNYNLDRIELVCKILSGKKVIHVGCADHIPLIEEKMAASMWLHGEMEKVVKKMVGLDINRDAVDFIKNKGVMTVYATDIVEDGLIDVIKQEQWDYLFLGEILEHINDPVSFLAAISKKYKNHVKYIIVTVPNAFRLANFKSAIFDKELINSDHRYWFTPYTTAKVLTEAGMVVNNYFLIDAFSSSSLIQRYRRKFFPMLCDTIVMTAKLKNA